MAFGPEMIRAWSKEISSKLEGKRCTGVESGTDWTVLNFGPEESLFFSLHHKHYGCCGIKRIEHEYLRKTAWKKPRFGEMLKKYVSGARLSSAVQVASDRILKLSFDKAIGAGFRQRTHIIFEFMAHRSNLLLTDESDRILEVLRPIHPESQNIRTVVPGALYTPPSPVSGKGLIDFVNNPFFDQPVAGLGKDLFEVLKKAAEIYPPETINKSVTAFLDSGKTSVMRFQWIRKTLTLFPFILPGGVPAEGRDALEASRSAVIIPLIEEETVKLKKDLLAMLERKLKGIRTREKGLETQKKKAEEAEYYKRLGKLLLAWQHSIPPKALEVELTDWEKDPPEVVKIKLDPGLSAVDNAQTFFREAKRREIPLRPIDTKLRSLEKQAESLRGMISEVKNMDNLQDLYDFAEDTGLTGQAPKKRTDKKPPFLRFELEGAMVLVGKNERGNRHVTFDLAKGSDFWLHAKDVPGSHVILRRLDGKDTAFSPDDGRLLFAASLAAYYSKYRGAAKVLVDYTERKHVTPMKGSTAGATYNHGRSIIVSPLLWKEVYGDTH